MVDNKHLYNILIQLLRSGDDEATCLLSEGIRKETVTEYVTPEPFRINGHVLTQLITPREITREKAVIEIEDLLDEIRVRKTDLAEVGACLDKNLTPEGRGKLLAYLALHNVCELDNQDVAEQFIKSDKDFQEDFPKSKPLYEIVVEQIGQGMGTGVRGKYSISLRRTTSGKTMEIEFQNKPAKALYLLFLMFPNLQISPANIDATNKMKIFTLYFYQAYRFLYGDSEKVRNSLEKNSYLKDGRSNFMKFITDSRTKANTCIEKAVGGTDDYLWYAIDKNEAGLLAMNFNLKVNGKMQKFVDISLPQNMVNFSKHHDLKTDMIAQQITTFTAVTI